MHYAYPGRKTSHPASFAPRQNRSSILNTIRRRVRLRTLGVATSVLVLFYLILSWLSSRSSSIAGTPSAPVLKQAPAGKPNVVVVTVLDEERGEIFNEALKKNRQEYAAKHGYATFMPFAYDYDVGDAPTSWAKVPALRHALTIFSQTPYLFYLDDHTLIANPAIGLEEHITKKERIEGLAIGDIPVVPPDSVIKTLTNVPADNIDFILVQDKEGLSVSSFVLRNGDWAKYFLDAWFDPLYRSYNFQKAERHALEHIVQWHGTLLAKLALIPQEALSSYTKKDAGLATDHGMYEEGHFIVSFGECDSSGRKCHEEMRPWFEKLHGLEI